MRDLNNPQNFAKQHLRVVVHSENSMLLVKESFWIGLFKSYLSSFLLSISINISKSQDEYKNLAIL